MPTLHDIERMKDPTHKDYDPAKEDTDTKVRRRVKNWLGFIALVIGILGIGLATVIVNAVDVGRAPQEIKSLKSEQISRDERISNLEKAVIEYKANYGALKDRLDDLRSEMAQMRIEQRQMYDYIRSPRPSHSTSPSSP